MNVIIQSQQNPIDKEKEIEEKKRKDKILILQTILIIIKIVMFIISLIWLFKVRKNAKNEPKNRALYIKDNPLNYCYEDDFCCDKLLDYQKKGAFITFDLRVKKIKKYSTALIVLFFIFIGLIIIAVVLAFVFKAYSDIFYIYCNFCIFFSFANVVLSIVFLSLFVVSHYKSNFHDFERFSECRYLKKNFQRDYNFVYKIKDFLETPIILGIINEFIDCILLTATLEPNFK